MSKERDKTISPTIQELLAGRDRDRRFRKVTDGQPAEGALDVVGPPAAESAPRTAGAATNHDNVTRARMPAHRPERVDEMAVMKLALPPFPAQSRRRSYTALFSFILFVVLPATLGSSYFAFIASNQYVTGFLFTVQDSRAATQTSSSQSIIPMATSFGGAASTSLENYIVTEYLTSRQALEDLQRRVDARAFFTRPGVDWLSRFADHGSAEKFATYWKRMVVANYDQVTGIAVAEVRAFTPEDAYLIAKTLLSLSEELVNEIATRPQREAVEFAERQLTLAEGRLSQATSKITRFRNTEQMIDPQSTAVATNVLLVQSLRGALSQLQAQLLELQNQRLDPSAPMVKALNTRIQATREQLAVIEAQVPSSRDGTSAISKVVEEFEQLDLERTFAKTLVNSALQQLADARAAAATKHMYVTAFVTPSLPQSSTYPRRLSSAAIFSFACLVLWTIGVLLARAIREHAS